MKEYLKCFLSVSSLFAFKNVLGKITKSLKEFFPLVLPHPQPPGGGRAWRSNMDRAATARVAPTIGFTDLGYLISFSLSRKNLPLGEKAVNGNVRFNVPRGTLTVGVSGFYYIYSQLYYVDGSALFLGHSTYVNDRKVLASTSSVVSRNRRYNTNYHGGVFRLQSGDQVSVKVLVGVSKIFRMSPESQLLWAVSRTRLKSTI